MSKSASTQIAFGKRQCNQYASLDIPWTFQEIKTPRFSRRSA